MKVPALTVRTLAVSGLAILAGAGVLGVTLPMAVPLEAPLGNLDSLPILGPVIAFGLALFLLGAVRLNRGPLTGWRLGLSLFTGPVFLLIWFLLRSLFDVPPQGMDFLVLSAGPMAAAVAGFVLAAEGVFSLR